MVQAAVRVEGYTSLERVRRLPQVQNLHMTKAIKIKDDFSNGMK